MKRRLQRWAFKRLMRLADRIAYEETFRCMSMTFTFERGIGIVFHENGGRGCRMWYRAPEYHRAHTEAENPT